MKRITPWLSVFLVLSVACNVVFLSGLPSEVEGPLPFSHRFDLATTTEIAGALCFLWGAIWIRALFVFRWRGLWFLLLGPGVLMFIPAAWMWQHALHSS